MSKYEPLYYLLIMKGVLSAPWNLVAAFCLIGIQPGISSYNSGSYLPKELHSKMKQFLFSEEM